MKAGLGREDVHDAEDGHPVKGVLGDRGRQQPKNVFRKRQGFTPALFRRHTRAEKPLKTRVPALIDQSTFRQIPLHFLDGLHGQKVPPVTVIQKTYSENDRVLPLHFLPYTE